MYQGYGTREAFDRRSKVAQALMASSVQRTPQNVGEGISAVGRALFGMLATRANKREEEANTARARRESLDPIIAALTAQGDPRAAAFGAPAASPTPSPIEATPLPAVPSDGFDLNQIGDSLGMDPVASSAAAAGIDPEAWRQQIDMESGGNANAVSPAGATGIAQIMPETARDPGFGVPTIFEVARQLGRPVPDESDTTKQALLRDPQINATFGAMYQRAMLDRFGDPTMAAAAYNAGPGAVEQAGGVPNFPETQNYVQNVQPRLADPMATTGAQPAMGQPQGTSRADLIPLLLQAAGDDWLPEGQRQVVNALLQQQLSTPEGMTAYQRATLDMRRQELEARLSGRISDAPVINNNSAAPVDPMAAVNAEARGKGLEALAKSAIETFNEGRNVATQIAQIDQLEGLLAQTPTGTVPAWQSWATEVLGVQANGGPAQAASAIINSLIPAQRPPGSGTSSDRDVAMFRASLPSLVNTAQGNAEIIAGMRAIAEYRAEIARIAGDATAGVVPYADGNAETDMIRQMREADARLSANLRERREANPEMYGQPFDAEAERRRLRELRDGGLD